MVTYYTALGRLVTRVEYGVKVPIIIINEREFQVDSDELMVWISLHWNFLNRIDLEREYNRKRACARIFNDVSFEYILNRLLERRIIVSATDYIAADALYALVSGLKIRPIKFRVYDRLKSCFSLYFTEGLPIKMCLTAYFGEKVTVNEKKILKLSENTGVTASEIIQCAEKNIEKLDDEEDIIEKLYNDPETTEETISIVSRFSCLKSDVLQAVANLYLKKKIIFE